MLVRVARFRDQPERFAEGRYRWVFDALLASRGFQAAYDVVDPSTGDSLSIGVFDDIESMRAAERAVGDERRRLGIAAHPPDEVVVWDVVESAVR
jgi:hypothetical protein